MVRYDFTWRSILNELFDFGGKVDFLQGKFRRQVIQKRNLNIHEYMSPLKELLIKHELNLNNIMKTCLNEEEQEESDDQNLSHFSKIFNGESKLPQKEVYN